MAKKIYVKVHTLKESWVSAHRIKIWNNLDDLKSYFNIIQQRQLQW